jgi:glutathione peroxidase
VNGSETTPLFKFLKEKKSGFLGSSRIKWNFTKFLIGRDGQVLQRYGPTTSPFSFEVLSPSLFLSMEPWLISF